MHDSSSQNGSHHTRCGMLSDRFVLKVKHKQDWQSVHNCHTLLCWRRTDHPQALKNVSGLHRYTLLARTRLNFITGNEGCGKDNNHSTTHWVSWKNVHPCVSIVILWEYMWYECTVFGKHGCQAVNHVSVEESLNIVFHCWFILLYDILRFLSIQTSSIHPPHPFLCTWCLDNPSSRNSFAAYSQYYWMLVEIDHRELSQNYLNSLLH